MSDIQIIISKYLADATECTSQEKLDLENFLDASEDNRRHFEELKNMWDAGSDIPNFNPDPEMAWDSLQKKLANKKIIPAAIEKKRPYAWIKIAAAIVFLIGLGSILSYFSYFDHSTTKLTHVIRTEKDIKRVILPDSSVVWLNKKTVLAWNDHFGKEERKVYLVGEAYFEITHNKQKPFLVYANFGTKTKVLGTSFSLRSRIQDTTVFVEVLTGMVEFASVRKQTSEKLILKKGEAAFTNYGHSAIYRSQPQENLLAWKEHNLSFSNTSLEDLCHTLEEYFSIRVELLSPAIRSCHFTGTFQSPTLNDIVEVLKKTMMIHAEIKGNSVFLSGTGCTPDIVQ